MAALKRADGQALYSPKPDTPLAEGDTLIVVGSAGVSQRLASLTAGSG